MEKKIIEQKDKDYYFTYYSLTNDNGFLCNSKW